MFVTRFKRSAFERQIDEAVTIERESKESEILNSKSEWNSAQGMPQSITYKLKEKAVVCKVTFLPRKDNSMGNVPKDCPKNFGIEGSNDGSSFVLIKRVEGESFKRILPE